MHRQLASRRAQTLPARRRSPRPRSSRNNSKTSSSSNIVAGASPLPHSPPSRHLAAGAAARLATPTPAAAPVAPAAPSSMEQMSHTRSARPARQAAVVLATSAPAPAARPASAGLSPPVLPARLRCTGTTCSTWATRTTPSRCACWPAALWRSSGGQQQAAGSREPGGLNVIPAAAARLAWHVAGLKVWPEQRAMRHATYWRLLHLHMHTEAPIAAA